MAQSFLDLPVGFYGVQGLTEWPFHPALFCLTKNLADHPIVEFTGDSLRLGTTQIAGIGIKTETDGYFKMRGDDFSTGLLWALDNNVTFLP